MKTLDKTKKIRAAILANPNITTRELRKLFPKIVPHTMHNLVYRIRTEMRTEKAIAKPAKTAGVNVGKPPQLPTTFDDDRAKEGGEFWNQKYNDLKVKYASAIKELVVVDRLVDLAQTLAPKSYDPAPKVPIIKKDKTETPQSAVLLLSDTHIGKVVDPAQTLGFGRYNFNIFLYRLKHLEERILSILLDHTSSQIDELVIAMLGDMVDGSLSHAAEVAQASTLFEQVYAGSHAVAQFVRNLSAYTKKIKIVTCVGNHGRWASQHKMPTKNRYSNLDMFFYAQVQALLSGIPSIEFELNKQPFQTIDVQGKTMWFGHGDHLKGGDKALGVPAHSIGRQLSTVSQMHAREGRPVPQIYCVGDKHRRMELPHCLGDFLVNGSFVGYDEYAHASNFPDAGPDQKLFLIHPKYGRGASYNIYLTQANELDQIPYKIPENFIIA